MSLNEDFVRAYEKYSDDLFRYCFYRVYDRERAKDLVQDTFIKTWQYLVEGNSIENLRAFLYRVAHNSIVDFSRKKREASLDQMKEKGFEGRVDVREKYLQSADAAHILNIVQQLDEKYREVILLRYVNGLSVKEISRMVHESQANVYVRIHRGLKSIKKILQSHE